MEQVTLIFDRDDLDRLQLHIESYMRFLMEEVKEVASEIKALLNEDTKSEERLDEINDSLATLGDYLCGLQADKNQSVEFLKLMWSQMGPEERRVREIKRIDDMNKYWHDKFNEVTGWQNNELAA